MRFYDSSSFARSAAPMATIVSSRPATRWDSATTPRLCTTQTRVWDRAAATMPVACLGVNALLGLELTCSRARDLRVCRRRAVGRSHDGAPRARTTSDRPRVTSDSAPSGLRPPSQLSCFFAPGSKT